MRVSSSCKIYKLLKGKDFIFLESNKKISCNTYLKSLSVLTKNFKNDEVLFPFLEISRDLQEIIKGEKIKS